VSFLGTLVGKALVATSAVELARRPCMGSYRDNGPSHARTWSPTCAGACLTCDARRALRGAIACGEALAPEQPKGRAP
jgi:hypothetical protein